MEDKNNAQARLDPQKRKVPFDNEALDFYMKRGENNKSTTSEDLITSLQLLHENK